MVEWNCGTFRLNMLDPVLNAPELEPKWVEESATPPSPGSIWREWDHGEISGWDFLSSIIIDRPFHCSMKQCHHMTLDCACLLRRIKTYYYCNCVPHQTVQFKQSSLTIHFIRYFDVLSNQILVELLTPLNASDHTLNSCKLCHHAWWHFRLILIPGIGPLRVNTVTVVGGWCL